MTPLTQMMKMASLVIRLHFRVPSYGADPVSIPDVLAQNALFHKKPP